MVLLLSPSTALWCDPSPTRSSLFTGLQRQSSNRCTLLVLISLIPCSRSHSTSLKSVQNKLYPIISVCCDPLSVSACARLDKWMRHYLFLCHIDINNGVFSDCGSVWEAAKDKWSMQFILYLDLLIKKISGAYSTEDIWRRDISSKTVQAVGCSRWRIDLVLKSLISLRFYRFIVSVSLWMSSLLNSVCIVYNLTCLCSETALDF